MDVDGYIVYTAARPSTGKELKSFKVSSREYQIIRKKATVIKMDHNNERMKTCDLSRIKTEKKVGKRCLLHTLSSTKDLQIK